MVVRDRHKSTWRRRNKVPAASVEFSFSSRLTGDRGAGSSALIHPRRRGASEDKTMHVLEAAHFANFMKSPRRALFGYPPAESREIEMLLEAALDAQACVPPSPRQTIRARLARFFANRESGARLIARARGG
jgi:hypothetical protein